MNLNDFKNDMAKSLYGMTKDEAVSKGICIQCKNPVEGRIHSEMGKREYNISGLCEICFDAITSVDEDNFDDEPAF